MLRSVHQDANHTLASPARDPLEVEFMKSSSVVLVLLSALVPNLVEAQSAVDPNASIVELRSPSSPACPSCTGCETIPGTFLDNCFETTPGLTDWLWVDAGTPSGRASEPSASDPVTVRVGPGAFEPFECGGSGSRGFVSVEGAGRDVTRFVGAVPPVFHAPAGACRGGITALGCTKLSFRDVTAEGDAGVLWTGAGDSQWQNVDMFADNTDGIDCLTTAFAWYDVFSAGGLHFFWNSRFEAVGGTSATNAFRNNGAEVWAYGSDFLVRRAGSTSAGTPAAIETATSDGMRIFGSTVRGKVEAGAGGGSVAGVNALVEFHMHGGIISIDASAHSLGAAIGIWASQPGALAHTPDTAFALKGATKIRLLGPGTTQSPFLWPSGTTPPSVISRTGADLFVKTDDGPGQDEARLLVYDSGCSPDPWRRVSDDSCL